ncbi:hypothetical protein EYF80_044787 [Liparis tanakae]|uniref:Uncharacterized protein n=1 Tax=Liparis tanakae TaxID=230148 RepID=A0A4Z2FVU9_9TELE|nr:hypothetical protein EYF80_044787 [Liparis tanakae]
MHCCGSLTRGHASTFSLTFHRHSALSANQSLEAHLCSSGNGSKRIPWGRGTFTGVTERTNRKARLASCDITGQQARVQRKKDTTSAGVLRRAHDTLGSDGSACQRTRLINGEVMDASAAAVQTSRGTLTVPLVLARQREGPGAAILCQATGP